MTRKPEPAGFAPPEDVEALFAAWGADAGLTVKQMREAGITCHPAGDPVSAGTRHRNVPVARIPYSELGGKPLSSAPGRPQSFRLRALRKPVPLPPSWPKYTQPAGSGLCAYFPRTKPQVLRRACDDPTARIVITEGEIKALKACLEGFPTIGLGGVDGWGKNSKGGLLPELAAISWPGRKVFLCFDNDPDGDVNEHVLGARQD